MKNGLGGPFLAALLMAAAAVPAHGQSLRFSGFGDFVFGANAGGSADPAATRQFERFGSDASPVNTNRGFGVTGTDFVVLADMTENATFLGEVNLQTGRGGSSDLSLDVERFFVNYRIDPRFNVQAGLFFTPIGYNNRFLYARAWLMNSIQVPDFFEEELNLFPTHSIGVNGYGQFELQNGHRLAYSVSVANGRPNTPDSAVYARDRDGKEVTGLVEWLIPGFKDSRIGVSGWTGAITSKYVPRLGDVIADGDAEDLKMRERGLDTYVVVNHRRFSINFEYVQSTQTDRLGNLDAPSYTTKGGLIEGSVHVMQGKLHPYVRYDRTSLPVDGGPYLSLRETDGGYGRVFIPEFEAVMSGVAYDVNQHTRLKGEYIHHLAGPRDRHGVAFQLAFGF
jgi:hypothetical protein